jgi:hypothetical protein
MKEHMTRSLLIVLFIILCYGVQAQTPDSLYVVRKGQNWSIRHVMKPGETTHMLATRFFISDGVLEYANEPETMRKLSTGSVIYIPVTKENYQTNKDNFLDMHELYYRVQEKDDIATISTYASVTKSQMRTWNNLHGNTLIPDQTVLFVGWVKMMSRDTSNPMTDAAYPVYKKKAAADTLKVHIPGGLDTIYSRQTNGGTNVITEKGTAAFFDKTGKSNVYYAFHNASTRGSIIKVYNPGTGKTVYVKVLGPVPDTKQYANCIIGICSAAKEDLGVTDSKAWCELSYSPN